MEVSDSLFKFSLFCGALGGATFLVAWALGMIFDPSWVFGEDIISDMGISETCSRYIFCIGCIITGFLLTFSAVPIVIKSPRVLTRAIFICMFIAGVGTIFLGMISEINRPIHDIFADMMFSAAGIGAAISVIYYYKTERKYMSAIIVLAGLLSVSSLAFTSFEFTEGLILILLLVWIIFLCFGEWKYYFGSIDIRSMFELG